MVTILLRLSFAGDPGKVLVIAIAPGCSDSGIYPCSFRGDRLRLVAAPPSAQGQQARRGSGKGTHLFAHRSTGRRKHQATTAFLMHVQLATAFIEACIPFCLPYLLYYRREA
jgi:hypothetical protein